MATKRPKGPMDGLSLTSSLLGMRFRCSTLLLGSSSSVGSLRGEYRKCVGSLCRLLPRPWCSGPGFLDNGSRDSYEAIEDLDLTSKGGETSRIPGSKCDLNCRHPSRALAPPARLQKDFFSVLAGFISRARCRP